MIVTVTPNPSVDRTLAITALERGQVLRATDRAQVDPGGKGINVVRALRAAGVDATAVVPVGGAEGEQLVGLLAERGITPVRVPIRGAVRANVSLVEPDGTVTKVNEEGPALDGDEVDALLGAAESAVAGAAWLVGSGSLPPGVGDRFWADLITRGHAAGARVAIDTSGAGLGTAIDAGPDLIKPNLDELAEAVAAPLPSLAQAITAAEQLRRRGVGTVLASLGADGALLVGDGVRLFAHAPVDRPVSSVGAGDSLLAGYLAALDRDGAGPAEALRLAVAYGAAAVQLPGSSLPRPADLRPDDVVVEEDPDPGRPLRSWVMADSGARIAAG
ncbi:1-phosphofructokinase [Euzebya sp.]|uniref:1-phosphofructokinase n=1 Tax=Euzebya sp. TaxID=1971409 RepID=UPI0035115119